MRVHLVAALAAICVAAAACSSPRSRARTTTLIVFAAASLTAAFGEIAREFESANPDVEVVSNVAGSQQLVQQLAQGAPCDVFASADMKQMEAAVRSGRIAPPSVRAFARNRLVVVVPSDNPARVADVSDLARPGVKLVLAAEEVPVGRYAREMLARAEAAHPSDVGLERAALANAVSYELDVNAVLAKVALGEADAGIVYATDVTRGGGARVAALEIPDAVNVVAVYPIAVAADSRNAALAGRFVAFVASPPGQAVLARYGFAPPAGDP